MPVIETTVKGSSSAKVRVQYYEFIRNANSNRQAIAEIYAKAIDPWVPYRTGKLSRYRTTPDGEIIYSATNKGYNYAALQYNIENYQHNKNVHPYATDHWDIVANPIIWAGFVKEVNELLGTKGTQHKPRNYSSRWKRAEHWHYEHKEKDE